MKKFFFPRLVYSGIKNNRKVYLPYLLSCIGMVMMFYIIHSLSYSPLLRSMTGGRTLEIILTLGKFVIALFSLFFLFYTNSFLIRRRFKEFGLYSILGMGKSSLVKLVACESVMVGIIGLGGGLFLGILFSKFAELGIVNIVHGEIDYRFTLSPDCVLFTVELFAVIFLLLAVKSVIGILHLKPLEMMRSENYGERPLKANWLFALLGAVVLGGAYYIAVTVDSPLTAMVLFFVAVLMVIAATYLLFIAGSVALCKMLQKNKKYYYKKQHFVSVSSMMYRMKRNGAGLASICIISTMVLVMVSSTSSLYFGSNDMLEAKYPQGNHISAHIWQIEDFSDEMVNNVNSEFEKVFDEEGVVPLNTVACRYASFASREKDGIADANVDAYAFEMNYDDVFVFCFFPLDDYNSVMNTSCTLGEGEALVCSSAKSYSGSLIVCGKEFDIVGEVDSVPKIAGDVMTMFPTVYLIVRDVNELSEIAKVADFNGNQALQMRYYYGFDLDEHYEKQNDVLNGLRKRLGYIDSLRSSEGSLGWSTGSLANDQAEFYSTCGGLFFIAIILSIVFIFAEVMIIYYKQVSEGYEDQSRFSIMQKVGMTNEDIKKSINSQVLTVFFAPLIMAGVHLAFSLPMVILLLKAFGLLNTTLPMIVTAGAFICFAVLYALIYKITARTYYSIVAHK